jgi:hypothetical protein
MNWYLIGLAAVSGVLAVLVAPLVFGKEQNKYAHKVVIVILFVAFTVLSKLFILPKINAYQAKAYVSATLKSDPFFVSLRKYSPDTYRQMAKTMTDSIEKGSSRQQAKILMHTQVEEFIAMRLPDASDASLVRFVGVMNITMGELQAKGKGLCFHYLNPEVAGGVVDLEILVSKATQRKLAVTVDEIIESSNSKRPVVRSGKVLPYFEPVMIALHEKYGDSVLIIDNPTAPGVDKEKVCRITRDLFQKIIALPPDKAGQTLRWIFAEELRAPASI